MSAATLSLGRGVAMTDVFGAQWRAQLGRGRPHPSARVYRLAFRLTGNRADAEDLTQEVFVRVFRALDNYRPGTFEAGSTASPRTSSSISPGVAPGSGSRRCPRTPSGCPAASAALSRSSTTTTSMTTCSAPPTRSPRTSAPPSFSVTSRVSPTRRLRLRLASSWAPYVVESTAAGPCSARRSPTAPRVGPAGEASRDSVPRPPGRLLDGGRPMTASAGIHTLANLRQHWLTALWITTAVTVPWPT